MNTRFTAALLVEPMHVGWRKRLSGAQVTALLHVANRPILRHALESFAAAGAEAMLLVGDWSSTVALEPFVRGQREHGVPVSSLTCERMDDIASVLEAIRASVPHGSACVIQPADGLLDGSPAELLEQLLPGPGAMTVLTEPDPLTEPDSDAVPAMVEPPSGAVASEVGLFGAETLGAMSRLARMQRSGGLAHLARLMQQRGEPVQVAPLEQWHRYDGTAEGLLTLNRIALDRITRSVPATIDAENRVEGNAFVDPTAVVHDSVIYGPAVIGPGALVRNAYVGPYTSVGAYAHIEGSEIDRSIVAARASVTYVSARLVASVVGDGARVFTDLSLPRALRLWVGDGDEVALC
jgi:glucose-1-phosphate thymidylyltransferase